MVRVLTYDFGENRSFCCAFASALVFAAYPMHSEDICWISGRADLLAAVFYLPALLFAALSWRLGSRSGGFYLLAIFFFVAALLCKESAVGLPLVIAALPLVSLGEQSKFPGWKKWFLFNLPFVLTLLPYLALRTLALGTPVGGYGGDMGRALARWLLERWLDPATVYRLLVPLPHCVFGDNGSSTLTTILMSIYAAIIGLFMVRLICQKFSLRPLLFLFIFALQALLPLYKLWGLDEDMHNQRLYYFLTMMLAMTLPMLVFAPKKSNRPYAAAQKFILAPGLEFVLDRAFLALFALLAAFFVVVDFSISSVWVDAGKQTKAIIAKTEELATATAKKLIILGIPKTYSTSHIILCGFCFKEFFEPPFRKESLSDRLLTFHSCLAGPEEPIESSRFKECIADSECEGPYIWSAEKLSYQRLHYQPAANLDGRSMPLKVSLSAQPGILHPVPGQHAVRFDNLPSDVMAMGLDQVTDKGGLVIENLDINPLDYDYLSFDLSVVPSYKLYAVSVFYDDKPAGQPFVGNPLHVQAISFPPPNRKPVASDFAPDGQLKMQWMRVRMRLSHEWRWYRHEKIRRIRLVFHYMNRLVINNAALESALSQVPQCQVSNLTRRSSGDYALDLQKEGPALVVQADGSGIAGAAKLKLVVTNVNEFFDNFLLFEELPGNGVESQSAVLESPSGVFSLPLDGFKQTGYYEFKVRAFDKNNQPLGDWSEGTTIYRPSSHGPAAYYRGN